MGWVWPPRPLFLPLSLLVSPFKVVQEHFPLHHTLIQNGFHLLSAKRGLIDPNYDEQNAEPWKKATVVDSCGGGHPAHNNSQLSEVSSTPTQEWVPARTVLGTSISIDLSYFHNNLETYN